MTKVAATPVNCHLIDALPYVFRAYFSLPVSMVDPNGNPVNAVYGFTNFLLAHLAEKKPTHVGVAFDGSLTTSFRNELYAPYKAQRELPPPELERQLDACQEICRGLGLKTYIDDKYEADDLIATMCERVVATGAAVTVVTNDKDLTQLVTDQVSLLDAAQNILYNPAAVKEKFGVRPDQIPDLLGLCGDAVDNIPGVSGVGKKTAVALIDAFDNVEELYRRIGEVATLKLRGAKSVEVKLRAEEAMARLSLQLATVARNAPMKFQLQDIAYAGAVADELVPIFERLGFNKIRDRVPKWRS
jgi:DNA polymerase-1